MSRMHRISCESVEWQQKYNQWILNMKNKMHANIQRKKNIGIELSQPLKERQRKEKKSNLIQTEIANVIPLAQDWPLISGAPERSKWAPAWRWPSVSGLCLDRQYGEGLAGSVRRCSVDIGVYENWNKIKAACPSLSSSLMNQSEYKKLSGKI